MESCIYLLLQYTSFYDSFRKRAIQIAGKLTDGLIKTSKPNNSHVTFDIFNKAGIEVGKNPDILEKIAKPKISYSEGYDKAFKSCEFWRSSQIDNAFDRYK